MNFTTTDHPTLVAPRPVRLPSTYHAILALFSDSSSDKDQASPRSSPRCTLSTEALEEFLSILRPSFFPPVSPVLRTRRQGTTSLPTFAQERSFSYKGRGRLDIIPQNNDVSDEMDITRARQPSRNTSSYTPDSLTDQESSLDHDTDSLPFRWRKANYLSSPISRNHTRNPFLRHASNQSPTMISPRSPAAVPLPLPTPDEVMETS